MKRIINQFALGDMAVSYIEENGSCGMLLYPLEMEAEVSLEGRWQTDSLVQIKLAGDAYPAGFSNGHTMRNSQSVEELRFISQESNQKKIPGEKEPLVIKTILESRKIRVIHFLTYEPGKPYISVHTEAVNLSGNPVAIELLSSFSVCGLFPFGREERSEDFQLYRMRSKWSAEGRLSKESFLDLQMEPSWQRYGVQSIRFGEVGSMPVRRFFPWAVIEDKRFHVMLGIQLYHNASWQIELYGRDERAAVSGGLADREFGHWMKRLRPGESFVSPEAVLSACVGDIDEISFRLTAAQKRGRQKTPLADRNLPVMFNEFCTTWGNPTEENLLRIVETIKGKGFAYCVIDAGWYSIGDGDWNGDMGDWDINQSRFPGGFERTVEAIRKAGMTPGLWMEMECVGQAARGFEKEEWQLKRDGFPLQTGIRRFWDMRNPEVEDYLTEKVIGILKRYDFGYLKVDYNDNIGIGCDGAESPGEGLRQCAEASRKFFEKIHHEMPELVIENCSSGGHRLEPSMQAVSSMSSFSDAHECVHIPIVAANVQRAILPEQSQIWAVLHGTDSNKRLYYSMINTLLGRMCLSGDIYELTKEQWKIVEEGIAFYKKAAPVIRNGKSRRIGCEDISYSCPVGWQAVVREGMDEAKGQILVVVHCFYKERRMETETDGRKLFREIRVPIATVRERWEITDIYGRGSVRLDILEENNGCIGKFSDMEEMEAVAVMLKKAEEKGYGADNN